MKHYIYQRLEYKDYDQMVELIIERHKAEMHHFSWMQELTKSQIEMLTQKMMTMFDNQVGVGIGAFDHDELIGFMMGQCENSTKLSIAKVMYEGISLKQGVSNEVLRHIYQRVSELWIKHGCLKHEVYIPLGDQRYLHAFHGLSFFEEQVYAIRDLDNPISLERNHNITIRIATEEDQQMIESMSDIIFSYQNQSPVFVPAYPEMVKMIRDGYKNIIFDKDSTILIAEKDFKPAGFHLYEPLSPSWFIPIHTIELTVAGTYQSMMRQGVGKALMLEGYALMKSRGYQLMHTDWRVANLASSTFWPSCGFIPYMKRVVRVIDQDIVWANFEHQANKR